MSDLDQVRQEVAELRQEVAELRDESAQTRVLAALADRDAAGMRAGQAGVLAALNALRETQVEQGRILDGHGRTLVEHGQVLGALVVGQERHTALLDGLTAAVGTLADRQEEQAAVLAQVDQRTTEHTVSLAEQGRMLAEILRRLPPAQD